MHQTPMQIMEGRYVAYHGSLVMLSVLTRHRTLLTDGRLKLANFGMATGTGEGGEGDKRATRSAWPRSSSHRQPASSWRTCSGNGMLGAGIERGEPLVRQLCVCRCSTWCCCYYCWLLLPLLPLRWLAAATAAARAVVNSRLMTPSSAVVHACCVSTRC